MLKQNYIKCRDIHIDNCRTEISRKMISILYVLLKCLITIHFSKHKHVMKPKAEISDLYMCTCFDLFIFIFIFFVKYEKKIQIFFHNISSYASFIWFSYVNDLQHIRCSQLISFDIFSWFPYDCVKDVIYTSNLMPL